MNYLTQTKTPTRETERVLSCPSGPKKRIQKPISLVNRGVLPQPFPSLNEDIENGFHTPLMKRSSSLWEDIAPFLRPSKNLHDKPDFINQSDIVLVKLDFGEL